MTDQTGSPVPQGDSKSAAQLELPPAGPASGKHITSLDGLRGVAVLMVMASHYAGSMSVLGLTAVDRLPFRFGWAGVDVFFALSGFLITGILLDAKGQPLFFRNFYARRVLRICPLYYMAILVVFGLRACLGADPVWGATAGLFAPGSLLWPAAYLENAAIALDGPLQTGILTHYWSLAVEEHFYLAWPLLVWACSRRTLGLAAAAAVAGSVLARAAAYAAAADPAWVMGLTPMRLDGLALGALASLAVRSGWPVARRTRAAGLVFLGAGGVLGLVIVLRHSVSQFDPVLWVFGYTLVAAASAALILAAGVPGRAAAALDLAVLRWFGKYSFGLYVWHPIIAVMLLHSNWALLRGGQGAAAVVAATLFTAVVTLAVAWLSFHAFEKRFLALKVWFAREAPPDRVGRRIEAEPLRPAPATR